MTIEGNIGTGKRTLLQTFEQSLSGEDNLTVKAEHEPIKEFKSFPGSELINPLEYFYKNPTDNAFYLPKLCTRCLSTKNGNIRNCSASLQGNFMDLGFDACQICTLIVAYIVSSDKLRIWI